jgi:predicted ATPase
MQTKGQAALETKASLDRTRSLMERAEALGEPPEDPLLLFSVLFAFWIVNFTGGAADEMLQLAMQPLALAEKKGMIVPLMIGHRVLGLSLMWTGAITKALAHYDQAMALYDPAQHRPLATRFNYDTGVTVLTWRSLALWVLGYPEAALAEADQALNNAREIGHVVTLFNALSITSMTLILCGKHASANAQTAEAVALTEEKGSFWKSVATMFQGCVMGLTGNASNAVRLMSSGIAAWRSTGSTVALPFVLPYLAHAHAELGQFVDAWRCIDDAITLVETMKERWCEADIHRIAGEIALMSPGPDAAKAEASFERALAIARQQQAKSWELRAAASMARLWRHQGKRQQAHDLVAPVYGWFTEGFDTLDLKEAKTLLEQLVP